MDPEVLKAYLTKLKKDNGQKTEEEPESDYASLLNEEMGEDEMEEGEHEGSEMSEADGQDLGITFNAVAD